MNLCYEEVTIESNSVPIVLSIWKRSELDPCILFIPGTAVHPLFYEKFLGLLSSHGFNVIGVHPVCHGKSPRVKELFSFEEMIQNGRDAITYAIQRFNDQIYMMGSSQGGIITIALAGLDHRIKAAFPHNILIPSLPESICVTRFPRVMKHFYKPFVGSIKLCNRLLPRLKIPVGFYLDLAKVISNPKTLDQLRLDPDVLMSYPLYFLSSLFNAHIKQVQDGSIQCPVYILTSSGDPLFPLDYTQQVFQLIQAPYKELMVFEENCHLLFNESSDQTIEMIIMKVKNAVNRLT